MNNSTLKDAGEKWELRIRTINNGYLVELIAGGSFRTVSSHYAKDAEGVVEILASVMGARVDVTRLE